MTLFSLAIPLRSELEEGRPRLNGQVAWSVYTEQSHGSHADTDLTSHDTGPLVPLFY